MRVYIEDIAGWLGDMNFMFEGQEQYFASEILFLPREHKIHIFEPTCNVLFMDQISKNCQCFALQSSQSTSFTTTGGLHRK